MDRQVLLDLLCEVLAAQKTQKTPTTPESGGPGKYVIVRTYSAGVHAGTLVSHSGQEVCLTNARRLWAWAGAITLSELAIHGTSAPKDCKFACPVNIVLTQAIEVIDCTVKAESSITEVPVWQK